jgi:hypothetical protein
MGYLPVRVARAMAESTARETAEPVEPGPRPRLSKAGRIGIGLLLTLLGLFLLAAIFPVAPGPLDRALPIGAAGIAAVWIGGIFMGVGSRS